MNHAQLFDVKRHKDEQIIYALFDTRVALESCFERLLKAGVAVDDISLMVDEGVHDRDFKFLEKNHTLTGATAGGMMGGTIGGALGGLAILGITGPIGAMVVGPMMALAAAGSLVGGLLGHGVPSEQAHRLQAALHEGKALMAVHLHEAGKLERAKAILDAHQAEQLELRA